MTVKQYPSRPCTEPVHFDSVHNQSLMFGLAAMKNITLSADESLIQAARARARHEHTTLNEEYRPWLTSYSRQSNRALAHDQLMQELRGKVTTGGRRFTRDEMNER